MSRSPQRLAAVMIGDYLQSMQGADAMRATPTTGRKIFGGGGLAPQRFVRPPQPNDAAALARVATQINTRRSLNRARGQR